MGLFYNNKNCTAKLKEVRTIWMQFIISLLNCTLIVALQMKISILNKLRTAMCQGKVRED